MNWQEVASFALCALAGVVAATVTLCGLATVIKLVVLFVELIF